MKQKSIIVSVLLFCISIIFSFSGCTVEGDTQYQEISVDTTYSGNLTTSDALLARFTPNTTGPHTITVGSVDTANVTLILSSKDDFTDSISTVSYQGVGNGFFKSTAPTSLTAGTEYYLSLENSGTDDTITILITQP